MGTRVSRNLLPLGSGGCQSKNDKIQFRLNVWKPIRIALRVPDMASLLACVCPVVLSLVAVIATCSEAQQKAPASSLPRGIVWNHASTKDSQVDRAALDALYSDTEKEQHYDLKGIVILARRLVHHAPRYPLSNKKRHVALDGHRDRRENHSQRR